MPRRRCGSSRPRRARGRLVHVGFMRRFDPGYVELKARLDAGGRRRRCSSTARTATRASTAFFDSAMIITDTVVHEIDTMRWLLGAGDRARDRCSTPRPSSRAREGLRDPLLVIFETEGGRLVDVEAFVNAGYGYDIRCEVVGEAGTLELPRRRHGALGRRPRRRDRAQLPAALRRRLPARAAERGSRASRPAPTAWDGYAAAAVCEAAVESLETGRRSTSRSRRVRGLAPYLGGGLGDQRELGRLVGDAELVALLGGGEPALGREAQLVDVDVA